jgi:hypothetical protein
LRVEWGRFALRAYIFGGKVADRSGNEQAVPNPVRKGLKKRDQNNARTQEWTGGTQKHEHEEI